jgi:hypothetical protein
MALNPVIRLATPVPGASAFPLTPGDFSQVFNFPYETEASGHWLFGTDNPNRLDMIASQPMARTVIPTLTAGGSGYPVSTTVPLIFSGGVQATGGNAATGVALTNGSGVVTSIRITNHGHYTSAPTATISTAGGGSGGTVTIALGAAATDSTGFLTTGGGTNSGLMSPINEAADQTEIIVFKRQLTAGHMIFDSMPNGTVTDGQAAYHSGSGVFKVQTGGMTVQEQTVAPPTNSAGDWLWLGVSCRGSSGRIVQWGGGAAYTATGTRPVNAIPYKCNIGPGRFGVGLTGFIDCAERIVIPRGMTAPEMVAAYGRSKSRLAARGITIL